ncbi:MAG: mycothiol synthase [Actinomycetes bacterium]
MFSTIRHAQTLSSVERRQIEDLAHGTSMRLGREAISEQAERALRSDSIAEVDHLLEFDHEILVGYCQLTINDGRHEIEMLGESISDALLAAARECAPSSDPTLHLWLRGPNSVSNVPPGGHLSRTVIRLGVDLPAPLPRTTPAGVVIRPFNPETDVEQWLAANAAAFVDLPDQGGWSRVDLEARMQAQWFDQLGFLVAESDREIVGFCWTKVHDDPWGQVGEIYVIGAIPASRGLGLGRLMTSAGLKYIEERGIDHAILYVESTNEAALRLYAQLGFVEEWRDVRVALAP